MGSRVAERRVHLKISGIVQGVGFRAFVWRNARSLGLKGYVRNLPDGTVEVVAEGDEQALRKLIDLCWRGPAFARVDSVSERWEDPEGEFEDFSIAW